MTMMMEVSNSIYDYDDDDVDDYNDEEAAVSRAAEHKSDTLLCVMWDN